MTGVQTCALPICTIIKERPDTTLVNEGANTLDFARTIIDMYKPRKRLDVGTWGVMGIGMGSAIAAAVETGKPVLAIEGDSAFGFSAMEIETICRYNLPVCVVVFNRSEEHTSELQSLVNLVCRLLLEKKKSD